MLTTRRVISYLLLLLLLARSFVPVDYMPAFGDDGKVQVVICTGHGRATISIDANKAPLEKPPQTSNDVCPFAPALSHALAHVDTLVLPAPAYGEDKPVVQAASVLSALAPKPWFSQGPPLLA